MAKAYVEKLTGLIKDLKLNDEIERPFEVKHFFNGAALYVDGKICASWSPAGLAFKLPDHEVARLISDGCAKPLRYFSKGHIKKGYALFDDMNEKQASCWKKYFLKAADHAALTEGEIK